jgi:hypothetical protein
MLNIKKFLLAIGLVPKVETQIDSQGEMEVLSTDGKLRYHNGETISPFVTEDHPATLTNKTIDANSLGNTISNIETKNLNPDTFTTSIAPSGITDTQIPSALAVKTYIDTNINTLNDDLASLESTVANVTNNLSTKVDQAEMVSHTSASSDVHGLEGGAKVVGDTSPQELTNKIITGADIRTPVRLDVKRDTLLNLITYASTSTNGQIVYANDTRALYHVVDGTLVSIGDVLGSSSSVDGGLVLFENETGKRIKSTSARINEGGELQGITGVTTSGGVNFTADLTDTITTGSLALINDQNASVIRLVNPSLVSVAGYANTTPGRRTILINSTNSEITIINASVAVSSNQRIITGTGSNILLKRGASVELIYNTTTQRHQVIGVIGEGNGMIVEGGGITPLNTFNTPIYITEEELDLIDERDKLAYISIADPIAFSAEEQEFKIQPWTSVTFGNNLFVAVANESENGIMTSPDGITWIPRTSVGSIFTEWTSVTFGNNLFVAVASSGVNRVMTSSDGITWIPRNAAQNNEWTSVTFGNNLFVAVSSTGDNRVMTSPDGITWTARNAAQNNEWTSVTFGNNLFVAVASSGVNRVMTSPDGITWTARNAAQNIFWTSVTFGNNLFVAVASSGVNRVMTSSDGITWTARNAGDSDQWASVTFGNGLFVAVGGGAVMTSPDGITWTARNASGNNAWTSVTFGNNLFVAVSSTGDNRVMTSPDGITWTARLSFLSLWKSVSIDNFQTWRSITFGNNLFVAVSSTGDNRVMTSPDGITWTARNAAQNIFWTSVTFGNNLFVAVGGAPAGTNGVMTSPDGITWTSRSDPKIFNQFTVAQSDWSSVTFGNGVFVAVAVSVMGDWYRVMTSSDGITWIPRNAAQNNAWTSVTFGNNLFVAVSSTGDNRVMTSPDGITWTARNAAQNNEWTSVTFGNNLFVAVASSGVNRVMTSSDGITWTASTLGVVAFQLSSITFGNGLFVLATGNSQVVTSPDGIIWTTRTLPANFWFGSAVYGKGILVGVTAGQALILDQNILIPDGLKESQLLELVGVEEDIYFSPKITTPTVIDKRLIKYEKIVLRFDADNKVWY